MEIEWGYDKYPDVDDGPGGMMGMMGYRRVFVEKGHLVFSSTKVN